MPEKNFILIKSIKIGIFALIISMFVGSLVHIFIPSNDLQWSLKAMGFTGYFAAFFSYYFAASKKSKNNENKENE